MLIKLYDLACPPTTTLSRDASRVRCPPIVQFLPDGRVLVLAKQGRLFIGNPDTGDDGVGLTLETYLVLEGVTPGARAPPPPPKL